MARPPDPANDEARGGEATGFGVFQVTRESDHDNSASDRPMQRRLGATPRKWERVLTALLSGRSLNRFEAERELHDHALHSTISNLQAKGLTIARREETVSGYLGAPTRVARYWLQDASSIARARDLLHRTRS